MQSRHLPRFVRRARVQAGVVCFCTALALERWARRMKEWRGWKPEECVAVPAWSLPDSPKMRSLGLGRMWAVLCPFCEEFHTHSPGEGGRMPHCCGEPDPRRYFLEFAGPLPVEHRTRFYRSSKSGLPRLLHHWPETSVHRSEAIGLLAA